jgi:hypothetical protein
MSEDGGMVYLVCSVYWEYNDEGGYYRGVDQPEVAFRDRGRAEAHWGQLEGQARKAQGHPNPARYPLDYDGCWDEDYLGASTSRNEETLVRLLGERGLPLPPARSAETGLRHDWLSWEWWQEVQGGLPEDELPWLWGLFDRVRFYELVEVPLASLGGPGA